MLTGAFSLMQCGCSEEEKWRASIQEIRLLNDKRDFDKSLPLARQLLALAKSEANPNPSKIAAFDVALGQVYVLNYQAPQAESLFQDAVNILENEKSGDKSDLTEALSGLGVSYAQQVKYKQAVEPLQRALRLEMTYGSSLYDRGSMLYYLGAAYVGAGQSSTAIPYLENALKAEVAASGEHHPLLSLTLGSLAGAMDDPGMADSAEVLYRRSLDAVNTSPPTEDTEYALCFLARFLQTHDKSAEALHYFERTLEVTRQVFPNSPRELGISTYDVGNCLRELGKFARAESLLTASHTILEQNIGPSDRNTARAVFYLALLRRDQNRLKEADSLFRQSLQVTEAVWGSSVTLAEDLEVYAQFLVDQKRFSEAEGSYRRVVAITESTSGPNFWKLARYYDDLAAVLEKLGKKPEMLEAKKRAESIRSNQRS